MDFGSVIKLLNCGHKCARTGWNGKGMFIFLVDGSTFGVSRPPLDKFYKPGTEINYRAHIDMSHANGDIGVWNPTNNDILAEDWFIVD